jgi:hypothetical protein
MHVQLVVVDRIDSAVAEFLVEHPRAHRDFISPSGPAGLFPDIDHAGWASDQRELT